MAALSDNNCYSPVFIELFKKCVGDRVECGDIWMRDGAGAGTPSHPNITTVECSISSWCHVVLVLLWQVSAYCYGGHGVTLYCCCYGRCQHTATVVIVSRCTVAAVAGVSILPRWSSCHVVMVSRCTAAVVAGVSILLRWSWCHGVTLYCCCDGRCQHTAAVVMVSRCTAAVMAGVSILLRWS